MYIISIDFPTLNAQYWGWDHNIFTDQNLFIDILSYFILAVSSYAVSNE